MMKYILILLLFSIASYSMDMVIFNSVGDLLNQEEYDDAGEVLAKLKAQYYNDPEYYVLVINYYFLKSRNDFIQLSTELPESTEDYFELKKQDSTGVSGYLYGVVDYDVATLTKGLEEFKIGLKKFPQRLDMHFGLAHVSSESKMYNELAKCLITILDLSSKYQDEWLWSFNEQHHEDPIEFVTGNIQSHIYTLFYHKSEQADSLIIDISDAMIRNFPDILFGYNNLGAVKSIHGEFDAAVQYFKLAYEIAPDDMIVISNLAMNYKKAGQAENAAKYFDLILEKGDQSQKAWASEKKKELLE